MPEAFARASAHVNEDELRRYAADAVGIPSFVGEESQLATYFVGLLAAGGLDAAYQQFDVNRGNAVARLRGDGSGPALLLYAPIDMHIAGNAANDGPWLELDGRPDLRPVPAIDGDFIIGLGAENPKGHAVCVAVAAIALARAGIELHGDVIVGLGGGGMPVQSSHGIGCAYMLEHGVEPDFAVIAKPGGAVAYEEVGLCWFKLTVHGSFNYAGIPPRATARNAVADAATLVTRLQAWFPTYTARNTSGLVAPNGTVSAIAGGWPDKPAFLPDRCEVFVDLRISPRTTPADAARQLDEALDAIRADGIAVDCEMIAAVPGTSTPPENWIVRSSVTAWEATYGRPHVLRTGTSGATDANILRAHGIPTARIGMPALGPDAPFAGTFSMGVVSAQAMVKLTLALIAIAIDTCGRPRSDAGLANRKELLQS
ncbi:MAG TPA: peptidase dimerization domain-containing protein [Candidatus Lustribacter sp.]|jgi:acetylornithine deacetylase/succinyl-diaminopimelate desuccinylase-like protein|nr:peptidase dimerization domain-containing protein [Candidatus Lustribacter sp.]